MKLRIPVLVATCGAILLASVALPTDALAQRRAVRVAPRRTVVVGGNFYRRPLLYNSWYFGYPWYDGYYGGYYGYGYYGPRGYYNLDSSMRLEVKPRETEVYVDGYYAGPVDDYDGVFQRLNIQPGEHEIELYLPGHRALTQSIYLQPGKTVNIKHVMEPLGPGESEPVKPSGGTTDSAITPSTPTQPGPATRRPAPANDPRYGRDGQPVNPPPSAASRNADAYGSLALRVQPGPANVMIDGEKWEGPQDNERFVVQLQPGRHVIEVQKDGYRRYTTEVVVRPNETAPLNVALSKN